MSAGDSLFSSSAGTLAVVALILSLLALAGVMFLLARQQRLLGQYQHLMTGTSGGNLETVLQDHISRVNDVAGRVVARHSRVHTFRGGVLTVALASAALRQELEVFQRSELLAALRERVRGVRVEDLRFTIM